MHVIWYLFHGNCLQESVCCSINCLVGVHRTKENCLMRLLLIISFCEIDIKTSNDILFSSIARLAQSLEIGQFYCLCAQVDENDDHETWEKDWFENRKRSLTLIRDANDWSSIEKNKKERKKRNTPEDDEIFLQIDARLCGMNERTR